MENGLNLLIGGSNSGGDWTKLTRREEELVALVTMKVLHDEPTIKAMAATMGDLKSLAGDIRKKHQEVLSMHRAYGQEAARDREMLSRVMSDLSVQLWNAAEELRGGDDEIDDQAEDD